MAAIVRLQGLPPAADSFDIRQFFYGLNIPRGGVYITGGKYGEAFIIFSTYEDANYAMSLTGRPLRNCPIYLSYSTEAEMRRALEVYRITPNGLGGGGPNRPKPSYVYIHGMPQKATKIDIQEFFRGFKVIDVLFLKFVTGIRNGNAIVRFAGAHEAAEALRLDGVFLCGCPVTLKLSDEDEWRTNGGDMNVPTRELSPPRRYGRRRSRTRSRSPIRRPRRRSPYIREFYVHLINVSYRAEKADLKKFFFNLDMDDNQITFLLDKDGKRTREAFVMFTTQKDYKRALNLNLDSFKGHTLNILPVSKKAMHQLIDRMKTRSSKDHENRSSSSRSSRGYKKCVYLRNFTSDVTKADIITFFGKLPVKEEQITLLVDDKGVCIGEVLVDFSDDRDAKKAEKLNHEKFKETEILLSLVSEGQKKELLKGGSNKDAENTSEKRDEDLVPQADELPDTAAESTEADKSLNEAEKESSSDQTPPSDDTKEMDAAPPSDIAKELDVTLPLEADQTEAAEPTDPVQDSVGECSDEPMQEMNDSDTKECYGEDNGEGLPEDSGDYLAEDNGDYLAEDNGDYLAEDNGDYLAEDNGDYLPEGMTQVFLRDLPDSVTEADISEFFDGYTVGAINLQDIGAGVATVLIADAEAESAVEALNEREIGLKKVLLSLD
ncbi:RNA-binding protein 12B-like [Gastrophryne carolinensis]